jgi:CheY-like chemotaxis protein
MSISIGEGSTGQTAVLRTESVFYDAHAVADNLSQYDEENRNCLYRIFEDKKSPTFQADYPILLNNSVEYILTLFDFEEPSTENMERHRLISLLVALLNLRIELTFAPATKKAAAMVDADTGQFGDKINEINNSLSAISGYCQLAARDPNLPGKAAAAFNSILAQTEELAESLSRFVSERKISQTDSEQPANPSETIRDVFKNNSISGNLHMIGGKPFSVNLNLDDVPGLNIRQHDFANFVNNVIHAFADNVDEDEIISISTYSRDSYIYLDISKHRDNFPPVEEVAGFGNYLRPRSLEQAIKDSGFLRLLDDFSGEFAYDRHSRRPSYYSCRFPEKLEAAPPKLATELDTPNILAVDDQAVILDLLAGMCQSLGYGILTARDGDEGLKVFEEHRPDIVITDLAMPRMSGWELATRIKALSPDTPIILITGWGVAVNEENMKRAGVDFVLRKPFRLEQLSEMITKIRFSRAN